MAIVTATATSYPVSYTTTGTINGTRYQNAIGKGADTTAVSGNDYSNGGSSSTATISYAFEFPDIPENADITSVTCQVKGHLESTSRSTANLQLYAGTTAKGTRTKFTSTSAQTITVTAGTWTRAEIDTMTLRFTIGYYGGLINGATVTVSYSYDDVVYTVTVDNQTSATVTANPTEVRPGQSSEIKADSITGLTITDNGADVTSQFQEKQDTAETYSVETTGSYGFALNSSGYYQSQNKGVSKTAAVCRVNFHVPVAATITFTFINYAEAAYDFGVFGNIDTALNTNYYPAGNSGATISDSSYKLACNTSTHNKSSEQTLTYSMTAGDHFIDVKYSKDDASDSNNDTLQFKVSISLDEPFTPSTYYAYTITNIQGDHTIIVSSGSGGGPVFYIKKNDAWAEVTVQAGYKKVNGVWTQVSDLSTLFDTSTKYLDGGSV